MFKKPYLEFSSLPTSNGELGKTLLADCFRNAHERSGEFTQVQYQDLDNSVMQEGKKNVLMNATSVFSLQDLLARVARTSAICKIPFTKQRAA